MTVRFSKLISRLGLAAAGICCVAVLGCSPDEGFVGPDRLPTFPVTGVVLVDGETVSAPKVLVVKFVPEKEIPGLAPGIGTSGSVDTGGKLEARTYVAKDGLPQGSYKVTFELGQINLFNGNFEGGQLNGKYSDAEKSEFTVTVTGSETGPIDMGTISLTSE